MAIAAGRTPPTADGHYYHVLATRLARGLGYTWAWPDGSVTYAAHYPVGYPGLVSLVYRIFGQRVEWVMILSVLLGALSALAVHQLAEPARQRKAALVAGLAVALHPGLVAYTPALMTEGVFASLLCLVFWLGRSLARGTKSPVGVGVFGLAFAALVLIRPQALLLVFVVSFFLWGARFKGRGFGRTAGDCLYAECGFALDFAQL